MYNNLQTQLIQKRGLVSGTFRLRNPFWGETKHGQEYLRIGLEDNSMLAYGYSWHAEMFHQLQLLDLCCVNIEGAIRWYGDRQVLDIRNLAVIDQQPEEDVVRLLPQSMCPKPWLLPHLQAALNKITIEPLKRFITAALGNDSIAFAFVSCPASLNHHHNYPGGLLMHSLDCFAMVEKHHNFQKTDYELGLVAALFHDIGKTLTMTHTMAKTSIGTSVEHDKLTFEVLGPYLRQLEREWPEGSDQLRYLLAWKLNKRVPRYNIADLVACCDRVSTGVDMEKRKLAS